MLRLSATSGVLALGAWRLRQPHVFPTCCHRDGALAAPEAGARAAGAWDAAQLAAVADLKDRAWEQQVEEVRGRRQTGAQRGVGHHRRVAE